MYRYYLFVRRGRLFISETISNLLQKKAIEKMGFSLGVNQYRHVAIGFMETRLKHQVKLSLQAVIEEEDQTLFDAQAGHSAAVAAKHYAVSQYDFKSVTSIQLQHFAKCSAEWQLLLGKLLESLYVVIGVCVVHGF
jgi:hypothetical protein